MNNKAGKNSFSKWVKVFLEPPCNVNHNIILFHDSCVTEYFDDIPGYVRHLYIIMSA